MRVPWDEEHVFYVWFDALLNYYSALSYAPTPAGFAPGEGDLTARVWPATYHLIGKDILRFHAVYWPAMLMAAEIELPEHIFVHGFLLMDGEKMSKSLGNVLDPFEVIERFGTDALRFYLLREVPFGQDGSVSTASFELRYESELANELGNLASRSIAMIARYRDGVLPAGDLDPELAADFQGLTESFCAHIDRAELTVALEAVWERVRRLNRYVEEQAPWRLAKERGPRAGPRSRAEDARGGSAHGHGSALALSARELREAARGPRCPRAVAAGSGAGRRATSSASARSPRCSRRRARGRHDRLAHPPGPVRAA